MELAFVTIHDLTEEATTLFASESIMDILGYDPEDVCGRSCFEYFHPGDVFCARIIYNRGVQLESASDLFCVRVRSRCGNYVTCECCFTVVNDILIACSRIYYRGEKSQLRAIQATRINHIFSGYPEDPQHNIWQPPSRAVDTRSLEGNFRAALILERFTRSLSIISATNTAGQVLGIQLEHLKNKSFYDYIHDDSLMHAEECLEYAKSNDSIVYLEFCLRDPRKQQWLRNLDENDVQDEMQARQGLQATPSTTLRNRGGGQLIPPFIKLKAIVFSTSDGLLVVLQHKLAARASAFGETGIVSEQNTI